MSDSSGTPWTVALQAPLSMGFSRQEYWKWIAISFSRGSSPPRDRTHISCIANKFFTTEPAVIHLATLGLHCCSGFSLVWAGEPGLLWGCVHGVLAALASLVVEHRLSRAWAPVVGAHGLTCPVACGISPDQGAVSPALAGRALTPGPLGHQGSPTLVLFYLLSKHNHWTEFGMSFSYISYPSTSVRWLSRVQLFVTPWTAARQASLSITNSQSLLKLMSVESVMPSNHLILCHPLLLLPSIFPSIRVFSKESALRIRWPKYSSFNLSISPSNEYSGLISFRKDWLDLTAVQGTLKRLLQHYTSKASVLRCSAFFMVQLSHPSWLLAKPLLWLDGPLLAK